MIPSATIYFWILVTTVSTVALLVWTYRSIEPSTVKNAFLSCLAFYLFYSVPLLVVHLLSVESVYIRFVSQMIHGGGIVFVVLLGRFLILLSNPSELKTTRYKLFLLNYCFLFVASFSGLIENGVSQGPQGLYPNPGILMPYFNVTMLFFGIYFLSICGIAYFKTNDDLLFGQLKSIFLTALPAFGMLMVTNAIIPGITGNFEATPAGALWLLMCFAGVGFVLKQGKELLLDVELDRIMKSPQFKDKKNLLQLGDYVYNLSRSSSDTAPPSIKQYSFISESESRHIELQTNVDAPDLKVSEQNVRQWIDAIEEIGFLSPLNATLFSASITAASDESSIHKLKNLKKKNEIEEPK